MTAFYVTYEDWCAESGRPRFIIWDVELEDDTITKSRGGSTYLGTIIRARWWSSGHEPGVREKHRLRLNTQNVAMNATDAQIFFDRLRNKTMVAWDNQRLVAESNIEYMHQEIKDIEAGLLLKREWMRDFASMSVEVEDDDR